MFYIRVCGRICRVNKNGYVYNRNLPENVFPKVSVDVFSANNDYYILYYLYGYNVI